jgi:hypothetical protein
MALACIRQPEWGLGSPRLFFLEEHESKSGIALDTESPLRNPGALSPMLGRSRDSDSVRLSRAIKNHPNPCDERWQRVISCTLDVYDMHTELTSSTAGEEKTDLPFMLKFSERMDLGCFLFLLRLDSGFLLLRAKPGTLS